MLHIDLPTNEDIESLAALRSNPTLSIYLRTTPLTQNAQTNRIELKNLLRTAVDQMEAAEIPKRSIWPIEEAVNGLIDDDDFWTHQANSLAIFVSEGRLLTFRLPNNLTSMVELSDRAHLKPLLRAVTFPQQAWVLAISIGSCRLVEVSADLPPHDVSVPNLPRNFNEALGKRSHVEKSGGMSSGESSSEAAMLTRYARTVERALRPVLAGDRRPLILAASEPLASIYQSVSSYPHTASSVIAGSADHTQDGELAASARSILDGIYAGEIAAIGALFAQRQNDGRATTDVALAARAATFGAIDTLVVDIDETIPGLVSEADGAITFADAPSATTYGVVDEIASRALRSGARVVSARRSDVPGGGYLAAILRYAI